MLIELIADSSLQFPRHRPAMRTLNALLSTAVIFAQAALSVGQTSAAEADTLESQAAKLINSRCAECHGAEVREGGLRFLSRTDLLNRNDSGEPAIVPGKSAESTLLARVTSADERMPPEGDPLTKGEIELLRKWIDAGAAWPDRNESAKHWAYIRPTRPELPELSQQHQSWARNQIDPFIAAKLQSSQLKPTAQATPAQLLRRVYLDLIGLPPSVDEVDAFLNDPSPEHYEQIVDKLLDSPRYGEKWARPWLDLARYADSNGFQADQFREIWPYRDWVINAINMDMPFDQFTIEQMAGDLLPESTFEQRIATGFHRCTTCNVEAGVDPEENRTNQIIDRINTIGMVWLGTSLECAQCHNHKYDPFTQQDYYQLFAFFNNTPLEVVQNGMGVQFEVSGPKMELPLPEDLQRKKDELTQKKKSIKQRQRKRIKELANAQAEWEVTLSESFDEQPQWHQLSVESVESTGGAKFKQLEDGSLLVTGPKPEKDTYTIRLTTEVQDITGLRLEALTDESLPGKGPGRGSAERPNFVLYSVDVAVLPTGSDEKPKPLVLKNPRADFSQTNWNVDGLIDSDPKTGWAINPQFGKPHWATFETADPIGFEQGTTFVISLPQHYGGARTLGRFRIQAMTGTPSAESVSQDIVDALAIDAEDRTEEQNAALSKYHRDTDSAYAKLSKQLASVEKQIADITPETTLVMVEMEEPRMTSIFKRGSFLDPLAQVDAAVPAVLHSLESADAADELDRLDFANWLVSKQNPLLARVTVNRWWAEFFGHGIVDTLEDFGTQGEPPTHPELLDWLAVEFMDQGWSMKHVHKLIVMSATYQQDSRISDQLRQTDPYNKLYARGPRVRLAAETIRDNALAISGLLSTKMAGPPVYPPQPTGIWRHVGRNAPKYVTDTDEDRFRRGIYVVWRRSAPYPSFVNFDAPDRAACVVKRSRTNTPLQALTLLNDPAYVEMARALAKVVAAEPALKTTRDRAEYAFRRTVSRQPASDEIRVLLELFEHEHERLAKNPKVAESLIPKAERVDGVDLAEQAAWFEVANVLLNLDETITKN